MNHDFTPFIHFWRGHESAFINDLYPDLIAVLPHYASLPREQLIASIERKNTLWQHLLHTGDQTAMLERTRGLVQQRSSDQFPLLEMIKTGDLYRDHLLRWLHRFYADPALSHDNIEQIETWTRMDRDVILSAYADELDRTRAALAERITQLERQAQIIHELATPLMPLAAHVIALPLVGTIDSRRAQQILETVLNGVVTHHATTAIIDITGVPLVDTYVAQALLRASQAVQLVGAQVVLTGIRPDVAQTLVSLGVNLAGMVTRSTLQDGIVYAFRQEQHVNGRFIPSH